MDVKNAVQLAIRYTTELFESEKISNLGLEEVAFYDANKEWVVTVGFSRPWDYAINTALAALSHPRVQPGRSFKIIRIHDENGEVVAVKNHPSGE